MSPVPAAIVEQLPVAVLMLGAVFALVKLFMAFIEKRDLSWQTFLKEQRETDRKDRHGEQESIKDLMGEIKSLTQEIVNLRADFEKAVAVMKERTQPLKPGQSKAPRRRDEE